MKGFCECGHPSRERCESHTIHTCEFKYKRKLQDWTNKLYNAKKYSDKYRSALWPTKVNTPEFDFLIAVEQIEFLLEDIINKERQRVGMGAMTRPINNEPCTCQKCGCSED